MIVLRRFNPPTRHPEYRLAGSRLRAGFFHHMAEAGYAIEWITTAYPQFTAAAVLELHAWQERRNAAARKGWATRRARRSE